MVEISPPPSVPPEDLAPIFFQLSQGNYITRIYRSTREPLEFRYFGPKERFDHQRYPFHSPQEDFERAIYYAAPILLSSWEDSLSCCIAECFGGTRSIDAYSRKVCCLTVTRTLKLLDLRGDGAMSIGSVAALSGFPDRPMSQAWSRYIYDNELTFTRIDGIIYSGAHNERAAIVLYERADGSFECDFDLPLVHPVVWPHVFDIARKLRLTINTEEMLW